MAYDPTELVDPTKPYSSDNPLARAISSRVLGLPATPPRAQTGVLAYSEDSSGLLVALTPAAYMDSSITISVPPTPELWLEWGASFQVMTAGAGGVYAAIYETTSNPGGALLCSSGTPIVAADAGTWSIYQTLQGCSYRVGPTTITRSFIVKYFLGRDAASNLAVSVRNTTTSPSFLAAIGR